MGPGRRRKIPGGPEERKPPADQVSSLELRVAEWLRLLHVPFEAQASIGPFSVDFLIRRQGQPDLVVEVNGCAVHGCPWCRCRPAWQGQRARDSRKYGRLMAEGYDVLVLGECQIEDHPEMAMARLAAACLRPSGKRTP